MNARAPGLGVGCALLTWLCLGCASGPPPRPGTDTTQGTQASDPGGLEVRTEAGQLLVRIRPPVRPSVDQPDLVAGGSRGAAPPAALLLGFRSASRSWRYEGCGTLRLTADGGAGETIAVDRETQIGGGQLVEVLHSTVPFAMVRALARATRITVALCKTEFTLRQRELALLRQLVERLEPPTR